MKNIEVIGMPIKYGCMVEGADLAYDYLKESLEKILNTKCNNVVDTSYDNPEIHKNDNKIKYLEPTMECNKRLYSKVYESLNKGNLPLIIGGDHSLVMGSLEAALDTYNGDVSLIYVDKHADIHNEKTTPSGNIHGMPLSICIGRCDERFDIGKNRSKPENLYFLGLANFEQEEIDYINEANIYHHMDNEINENNIKDIIQEIKNKLNTKYVHLSFDLDSIKDEDFHAVNVSVENTYQDDKGMSYNTVKKLIKEILNNFNICSMDIVEYNPLLDEDGKCKEKIEEILLDIKNTKTKK